MQDQFTAGLSFPLSDFTAAKISCGHFHCVSGGRIRKIILENCKWEVLKCGRLKENYFPPVYGGEFELDASIGHSSENRAVFSASVEDYSFQLKAS